MTLLRKSGGACAGIALLLGTFWGTLPAQTRGGGRTAEALFAALDKDGSGTLSGDELQTGFNSWFKQWNTTGDGSLTREQMAEGLSKIVPAPPAAKPGQAGTFNSQGNSTPIDVPQSAVDAMMAALPTTSGAKPLRSRKVLVLAHTGAGGFVHTSIPLAAKAVEALGKQGGLWSTTLTYDAGDVNRDNLKQYDAIFLDSTTACFLDDPDPSVTQARRAAFLDFVQSGKGIAGIHAASDAYHTDCAAAEKAISSGQAGPNGAAMMLAERFLAAGDKDDNDKLSQAEWSSIAEDWQHKLDSGNSGQISRAAFVEQFNSLLPRPKPQKEHQTAVLQWPPYNELIGGYFKFHWPDPQLIYVKIDDPNSPLTAMFHGKEFEIHDETYTFAQNSFSRKKVHVLTSIDYAKMSAEDKAKEADPRTDQDYALSFIHREGKGRVFYEGHGHDYRVYAMTPMLEHIRAGIQYALGDLKADDSPSEK